MLKSAISFISEVQNKSSTLKESIINAADGHKIVMKAQKEKQKQDREKQNAIKPEAKINIQELKKQTEKLVLEDI